MNQSQLGEQIYNVFSKKVTPNKAIANVLKILHGVFWCPLINF